MENNFKELLLGYEKFRYKYAHDDRSIMEYLSYFGQKPKFMFIACCDSRVDPAVILQCKPGDLFVVRNVANIVPPFESDEAHHGTSAALEFAIRYLKVEQLIIFGHSQCGGIESLISNNNNEKNDFISNWVSLISGGNTQDPNEYAKFGLKQSYKNCMTFPWLKEKVDNQTLGIHLWYFDIKSGEIQMHCRESDEFKALDQTQIS